MNAGAKRVGIGATRLAIVLAAAATLAVVAAREARAQSYPSMRNEHLTIAAIRIALWGWMQPVERARLDAIDTSDTRGGSPRRLMFIAADRVARVALPMALGAARRPADAARVQALAEITDAATARAATRVLDALVPLAAVPPSSWGVTTGPLGCDMPIVWASIAVRQAGDLRAQGRADAAMAYCAVARVGADRARVVAAALALVRDLANAARAGAAAPSSLRRSDRSTAAGVAAGGNR